MHAVEQNHADGPVEKAFRPIASLAAKPGRKVTSTRRFRDRAGSSRLARRRISIMINHFQCNSRLRILPLQATLLRQIIRGMGWVGC